MPALSTIALNGAAYLLSGACLVFVALVALCVWLGAQDGDPATLTALVAAFPAIGLGVTAPLLFVVLRRLNRR